MSSRGRAADGCPRRSASALYTLATLLVFGHLSGLGSATMTAYRTADQITQVWWLEWAQFALAHGHNPFFTNWQNYPLVYNFGVNGSMLAIGAVFSPLTTLFGPLVTWNVLLRLAMIASAFSMCLLPPALDHLVARCLRRAARCTAFPATCCST